MLRYIFWVLLLYFGWKIISTFVRMKSRTTTDENESPNFQHLEEAQFEDITDVNDSEKKPDQQSDPKDEKPS
ncbi:MAG: hypothetical protein HY964_00395 [Ignavibacteriales bacterium]|nr:hypothetical protein [Ignavibacteriales bacterium]